MNECPCPRHPFGCRGHPKTCGCESGDLTALVHAAYIEGFSEGMREYSPSKGGKRWNESRIYQKLAQTSAERQP